MTSVAAAATAAAAPTPNQTLYLTNLNDKIRKPDLRVSLYMLFSTYGVVLDVVALKTMKHRGQAHIAFRDVTSATQAMRALDGMNIFGKEMVWFPFTPPSSLRLGGTTRTKAKIVVHLHTENILCSGEISQDCEA